MQVSSTVSKLRQDVSHTSLVSKANIPDRTSWDLTLNRVLEEIGNKDSPLTKVLHYEHPLQLCYGCRSK